MPIAHHAQGAGLKDAVHEGLAALVVEQARLVVVGIGREERITRGEVEQGLVPVELFVAEEAERHITGAVALDGRRRPEPEGLPVCLDALALGHQAAELHLCVVEFAAALVDDGKQPINLPQLIRQISEGLPQLHLFLPGLDVVFL